MTVVKAKAVMDNTEKIAYSSKKALRHRKLDLTGYRFGLLTVLSPADIIGKLTAW